MDYRMFVTKFASYDRKFIDALYRVLMLEGGISNDKDDSGGYTKFGISQYFFTVNKAKMIEEGIIVPNTTVQNLVLEQAVAIYYRFFWKPLRCDEIENNFVRSYLFDSAVNMGIGVAVSLLQKAVNDVSSEKLVVDGIIGFDTITKTNKCKTKAVLPFIKYRVKRYVYIAKQRNNIKFLNGWINRAYSWNDLINVCNKKEYNGK